jgi:hypothetical protein
MKIAAAVSLAAMALALQTPVAPVAPLVAPAGFLIEGRYAAEPIATLAARPPAYDARVLEPRS